MPKGSRYLSVCSSGRLRKALAYSRRLGSCRSIIPKPTELRLVPVVHRPRTEAPVPGLRAVLYAARTPILFIVDTRHLTLAERGLRVATTMGLDLSGTEFLAGLERGAASAPAAGLGAVIFDP